MNRLIFTDCYTSNVIKVIWLSWTFFFPFMSPGSRVPAGDAAEGHQGCEDPRKDEAGEASGGRQPDPAGQEGQNQEQPAEAGGAGEGAPREPLPGPDQRHRQSRKRKTFQSVASLVICLMSNVRLPVCPAGHQEPAAVSTAQESRAGQAPADKRCPELKVQVLQHSD